MTNEFDPLSLFPAEASRPFDRQRESLVQPAPSETIPTAPAQAVPLGAIDDQMVTLAAAGGEVTRIGELVSALEARISKLIDPDQPLAVVEARARQLEHRSAEIAAQLEHGATVADGQANDIGARLAQTSHIVEQLSALEARISKLTEPDQGLAVSERRAHQLEDLEGKIASHLEQMFAQLEQTAAAADAQKKDITARLVEVDRIGEQVSTLEARISKLTDHDQPLAVGAINARQLEQRGAEIAALLQQCAAMAEGQSKDMMARATQVDHIGEAVSTLEARIGKLTDRAHALAHSDGLVGQLEHRLAETTAEVKRARKAQDELGPELKRARKAHDDLSREVARLHQQLSTLREAALKQVEGLPAEDANARIKPWITMGVVAGVTGFALAGIIAARSGHVAPQERTSRAEQSIAIAPMPVLLGRPLRLDLFATTPAIPRTLWNEISSAGTVTAKQLPARVPAVPTPAMIERSSKASLAANTSQSPVFTGGLEVQSNPPGSTVLVDRKYVGHTPIQLTELRAGSHVVWIQRDGYQRWTASVLVTADKQTLVAATLQPERER